DRSRAVKVMLHRAITLAKSPRIAQPHQIFGDPVFRPDGKTVVAASDDGSALVVDAATGRIIARLDGPPGGKKLRSAISGDGSLVASARSDSVVLWDGGTTRTIVLGRALDSFLTRLALDDAGKRLAVAVDRDLIVWDARSGAQLWARAIGAAPRALRWVGDA